MFRESETGITFRVHGYQIFEFECYVMNTICRKTVVDM